MWVRDCEDWMDIAGEVVTLQGGALTRLDGPASFVWRLLDHPVREDVLVAVVQATAGAERLQVAEDVVRLLGQLEKLGLIRRSA